MMRRFITALCFCVVTACGAKRPVAESGPRIPVPPFQIKITLTDAATKKLRDSHETIKGAVYFDGDGTPKPGEDTAPFRAVFLGSYEFETEKAGVISVGSATVAEEAVRRLSNADYYYTINVYSGRRAFKDNILNGGYAGGHISEATKAPIEISCGLLR